MRINIKEEDSSDDNYGAYGVEELNIQFDAPNDDLLNRNTTVEEDV